MVGEIKQIHWQETDLADLEQRYRGTFINSIGGFKSVCLVGTKNTANQSNLAIFSSLVHIGANPPLVGLVFRPDSVERHTLENILETGFYTINNICAEFVPNAHQTAARYARNASEFENCGLTEAYKSPFFAPFVGEATVQMGVEFKESIPISSNGTLLVIGQIKHAFFPENCLHEDGFLDLNKAGSITCAGLDAYYTTEPIGRYAYAKTDRAATILPKDK